MSDAPAPPSNERVGVICGVLAYGLWGVMPVYWRLLHDVGPIEITAHRILWCAVFVALVTFITGQVRRVLAVLRTPRTLATLALSSLLICGNWTLYIYCVETNQLVEASLGYYITPLISFALGVFLFGERISPVRWAGIALATVALALQVAMLGHIPWIAPTLAISFGLYGYLRKRAPVAALDGLLIETLFVLPVALGLLAWWTVQGTGAFPASDPIQNLLFIGAGPLTAIPLALFAAAARRVRMSTLGFLQYLAPSITLSMAVFGFGEAFSHADLISFGCVWAALAIVAIEGRFGRKQIPSTGAGST